MKIKELSATKSKRNTIKSADGSYASQEAAITLTVEGEEGKLDEIEVIDRVKQLLDQAMDEDPSWMRKEENDK